MPGQRADPPSNRRHFLIRSASAGAAVLASPVITSAPVLAAAEEKRGEDVSPPEDLMREHGALNRMLLIYEEGERRLKTKEKFDIAILAATADLVRRFVEDYHEKLEENYLFPRFRKAGKLVDLVDVLLAQHQAGRALTRQIATLSVVSTPTRDTSRERLLGAIHAFVRMYRPHEAREDTVLFPAFREVVSRSEFQALGEQFEKKENELFGNQGFEKIVSQVAELEQKLGIYRLEQFTPQV